MNQALYYLERSNRNSLIELWSKERITDEARGWVLDMKKSLQHELQTVKGKGYLYANFISNRTEYFDIDNVLFNHVGNSVFTKLAVRGLCYERLYQRPPKLNQVKRYPYYSSYQVLKKNQKLFWRKEKILAKWTQINLPALNQMNVHTIWQAMRYGNILIKSDESFCKYGINLKITGPIDCKINLTTVVKPLIEGVVSAFQNHNGALVNETIKRLKSLINLSEVELITLLTTNETALLGEKSLILPYHKSIKWYPDIHQMALVNITYKEDETIDYYYLSGELFGVKATKQIK